MHIVTDRQMDRRQYRGNNWSLLRGSMIGENTLKNSSRKNSYCQSLDLPGDTNSIATDRLRDNNSNQILTASDCMLLLSARSTVAT